MKLYQRRPEDSEKQSTTANDEGNAPQKES
jgi:hypothetical protein